MATIQTQLTRMGERLYKARENESVAMAEAFELACEAYQQEVPITTIANSLGVTVKTLYAWLRHAGLYPKKK